MKIVLAPVGTDGDIRPMIALGKSLQHKGHEIIFCAPPNNEQLVTGFGLVFHPVGMNMKDVLTENKKEFSGHSVKGLRIIRALSEETVSLQMADILHACKGADYLLGSGNLVVGRTVAEYYNIPYHHVFHIPQMLYSKHHAPIIVPYQKLPQFANLIFWQLNFFLFNKVFRKILNNQRQKIGLQKINDFYSYCYDKIVLSADSGLACIPEDVKADYIRTGYWYLEDNTELGGDLERFINSEKPVVYIGFGSMAGPAKSCMDSILNAFANKPEFRFVILKGWAGLDCQIKRDNIMLVNNIPHSKLFKKMSVIVHHGGAGTTHTASRAGKPQIIVPHMIDQYYWGERIRKLGLGYPVRHSGLNGKTLLALIEKVINDKDMAQSAAAMGQSLMQEEDGVEAFYRKLGFDADSFQPIQDRPVYLNGQTLLRFFRALRTPLHFLKALLK
jgi:UDP:flavonoid glycosyltransferase YjiC (YdhE family)